MLLSQLDSTRRIQSSEGRAMCQVWPRVAEVWPMCGRSTAGVLCAAAELHTVRGAAKDHDAPDSGQCGQKNCCLRIHVPIRASL